MVTCLPSLHLRHTLDPIISLHLCHTLDPIISL